MCKRVKYTSRIIIISYRRDPNKPADSAHLLDVYAALIADQDNSVASVVGTSANARKKKRFPPSRDGLQTDTELHREIETNLGSCLSGRWINRPIALVSHPCSDTEASSYGTTVSKKNDTLHATQMFDRSRESVGAIASGTCNEIIGRSGCFSHRPAFIHVIEVIIYFHPLKRPTVKDTKRLTYLPRLRFSARESRERLHSGDAMYRNAPAHVVISACAC